MKCWKCEKENVQDASRCIYCSANLTRTEPNSEIGKALRRMYDHYGAETLLSNQLLMVNGLGDLVQDSGKFRGQLKIALDAGIGKLYLDQIRSVGYPDTAFDRKIKTVLSEELAEPVIQKITNALDEMIGWSDKDHSSHQKPHEIPQQKEISMHQSPPAPIAPGPKKSVRKSVLPKILVSTVLLALAIGAFLVFSQSNNQIPVPQTTAALSPTATSVPVPEQTNQEDYEYKLHSDNTIEITKYLGDAQNIILPSAIDSKPVSAIAENAFYSKPINTVIIPPGIQSIENYAFAFCTELTSISIPESIINLNGNPFYGCSKLSSVNIDPDNPVLKTIDNVLFNKAGTTLKYYPSCLQSKTYSVPAGVQTIGPSAFGRCTNLETITLPDSIVLISDFAFYDCSGLLSVNIPDNVDMIGDFAFSGCTGLTSISIPSKVKHLGANPFSGCNNLSSLYVSPSNPVLYTLNNALFHIEENGQFSQNRIVFYPRTLKDNSYSIPAGVTDIDFDAFCDCVNLHTVSIPDSVRSISNGAFQNCINLRSITIPKGIMILSNTAFDNDPNLIIQIHRGDTYSSEFCQSENLAYKYID